MKYTLSLLLILLASCAHARAGELKTRNPIADAVHYAVSIVDPEGDTFCSGSIVDGSVLTAGHCAIGAGMFYIKWMGQDFAVDWVDEYPEQDTAILHVDGLPKGLRLAKQSPGWGDPVFTVGNPLGVLERNMARGYVMNPKRDLDLGCDQYTCFPNPHLMIDALIVPGSSGSPVFDLGGQVVGVVSFTFGGSGNLGGAVHLETLTDISKRNKTWNG